MMVLDRASGGNDSGFAGVRVFLFNLREHIFENVERHGGFVFVDDKRRTETDGSFAAAENHEATFEGEFFHAIAQRADRFARGFIFHQLDADHEAASAHIANERVRLLPTLKALEDLSADAGGVVDGAVAEDFHGGKRSRDADRVAAEGRRVGAGHPIHDFGTGHANAKGHAAGYAFGHADDVGLDAGVLDGPPLAGAARAALHFVGDEED